MRALAVRRAADGRDHPMGEVVCRDGWDAAKMLYALAVEDSRTPGARDLALALRRRAPSDEDFAREVHRYVKENVAFVREAGEVFQGSAYTLGMGAGDCDDHARAVIAIALAGGLPARLALLHRGKKAPPSERGPTHAVGQLCPSGACAWAETTVDAAYGEAPLDAARRLGLLKNRSDLATEVRVMTEKDLGPIPPGFSGHNPPEKVMLDAAALCRLGYLDHAALPLADPTDPVFRRALLAFQVAMGITADALIGPQSRHAIASVLPPGDALGAEYRERYGAEADAPGKYMTDEGFRFVADMVRDFQSKGARVTGEDFLAIWLNESGLNPHRPGNPPFDRADHGAFGGLNQMNAQARAGVGFTGSLADWLALSDVEQLPFVRRFYEVDTQSFCGGHYECLSDGGSLYLMNFLPKYMPHHADPSFVLARRDGPNGDNDPRSAAWYRDNAGLDVGGKGWIEVADLAKKVAGMKAGPAFAGIVARYKAANGGNVPGGGNFPLSSLIVGGVVGAAALAWWVAKS